MANIAIVIQSRLNAAVATNPVGVIDKRKATFADLLMSNPALHLQQNDERSANAEVIMLRRGAWPAFLFSSFRKWLVRCHIACAGSRGRN